ncbi:pyridoxamine 5'-phosphate oxidase family protein [Pseudonocardia lacus]|uniref:pyridoxamine 5'-phosphate oxidase family protein n=1 Tax=Pseudonocardia lacus TaxID=2835865 RepID=UPI001BDD5966|nr:pyridoxamine 5'-phosphate oxidase family protein [Pseudonocardia lacus]
MQRSARPRDEPRELVELDRAACLRLLGTAAVGRVIFTEAALPTAQPVSFLLDDEEVVFQTSGGSKLAVAGRHHVVAFEVDDLDPVTRTGWSVVGVGEAYEVVDPQRLAELAGRIPAPWATGRTGHVISIPLQRLTGRRLG